MKILKIRRGFTTNSSSASEFIPPANSQAAPQYKPGYEPIVPPSALPSTTPATVTKPAQAFPLPVKTVPAKAATAQGEATAVHSAAPSMTAQQTVANAPPSAPAAPAHASSGVLIGGFAALVALAFVVEKLLRRFVWKPRKDADDV